MRLDRSVNLVLSLAFTAFAAFRPMLAPVQAIAEPAEPEGLPPRYLIAGVAYITWGEAARLEYQDKRILNPSFAAALGMVLQYWRQDLALLKRASEALPSGAGGWGIVENRDGKSLQDLKPFIARGIPVLVSPALTPVAHTPSPMAAALAESRGFKFREPGPHSGVLGRMIPLETFRELDDFLQMRPFIAWESLFISSRVAIGYDDDRGVLILHDPSFGPAWEVSYRDFEKMWGPRGRNYTVAYPPDHAMGGAVKRTAPPYRPRTADEQAAVHFVFGYALSSVGRGEEAESWFRQGFAIPGIDRYHQHLLLFELALQSAAKGSLKEAIAMAQKASALLPEHHRPWRFLAQLYRGSRGEGWEQKAAEAESKAQAICADAEAQKTVAKALARNFFVFGCGGLLEPIE